jgi:hypothetical protein
MPERAPRPPLEGAALVGCRGGVCQQLAAGGRTGVVTLANVSRVGSPEAVGSRVPAAVAEFNHAVDAGLLTPLAEDLGGRLHEVDGLM